MLMHGCKEGQCAACKSFILDGEDIEHDRYSTFALPDYELDEGYTLLCRAHAYEDVTIELLNYDEEMIRSGLPIQQGVVGGGVQGRGHPRHAPPDPAADRAGRDQVLPRPVHGHRRFPGRTRRGPSRWRTPPAAKAGCWSSSSRSIRTGCSPGSWPRGWPRGTGSTSQRPVRRLHPPRGRERPGLRGRRGGHGADPVAAADARPSAASSARPPSSTAPGPSGTCCFEAELHELEEKLPNFRYIPALSDADVDDQWDGETGFVTDVVKRHCRADLTGAHAYVCGPPPMVEAALPLLAQLGVEEKRIYYDKFTTTGDPGQQ